MDLVNQHWPHDPVLAAFYRDALTTQGEEAVSELWSPQPGVWDDSLLEPVVRLVERTDSWIAMDRAIYALNQHYAVWAGNAVIPARLSKALLAKFPSLTNASVAGPRPGEQLWCNAVGLLAETHDRAMIAVLRPFLRDKVVAGDGSYWANEAPVRACDEAAVAIGDLLGEKEFAHSARTMAGTAYGKAHNSYPEWKEWDERIAELQKRLDAGRSLQY
jgi:hypothetical protein